LQTYKVRLTDKAEQDLIQLFEYISETLFMPASAERIYSEIKAACLSLGQSPKRGALVRFEPCRSMSIRWIPVQNYTVFFRVDDERLTVSILRILYKRREWQTLLSEEA
jgi:plasmid stabilization system protein ParE